MRFLTVDANAVDVDIALPSSVCCSKIAEIGELGPIDVSEICELGA